MNKFWQFRAQAGNPKIGELLIYGPIASESWWGDEVTPVIFREQLEALGDVDEIHVFINSDGGDVFAAQAMLSMLKRHQAKIVVYVDGIAASSASVVAMAGDVVIMPANAMMMVHKVWTIAQGNEDDFRKMADDLAQVGKSVTAAYQEKTELPEDQINDILAEAKYMTAEEAVELGFADQIESEKLIAASLNDNRLVINGQQMNLARLKGFEPIKFYGQKPEPTPEPVEVPDEPVEPPDLSALETLEAMVATAKQRYH